MKIEVMYFGRPSEYLLMTSERLDIHDDMISLNQVLGKLRSRNSRWAYELDESHVICAINQKAAGQSDILADGDEIDIFSSRSLFEM